MRNRRGLVAEMVQFKSMSMIVALAGMLSFCPAHAGSPGQVQPLRGGGGPGASPLSQVASAIGQSLGYGKKDAIDSAGVAFSTGPTTGPTTGSSLLAADSNCGYKVGLPKHYEHFDVKEGPLAESIRMFATQERALLVQASRCRAAMARLDMLQKIMESRSLQPKEDKEVDLWKVTSVSTQRQLKNYLGTAGKGVADLLGEKSLNAMHADADLDGMSSVTPDYSEDEDTVTATKRRMQSVADGPTIRTKDGTLTTKSATNMQLGANTPPGELAKVLETDEHHATGIGKQPTQGPYAPTTWSGAVGVKQRPSISPPKTLGKAIFAQPLEDKYRVATYDGIPVYGAVKSADGKTFSYLKDTELHLVWDIDQSKLVGEGTNDVELVIKCVLWWKEEMSHDPHFVPTAVPNDVRKEFQQYCNAFDIETALESVMPLLVRPGSKEFVDKHLIAKWWTFTNKDREVDGQVVRDVSDDDGQVGMFQSHPHEISGRPVVDANKYALQVLDRTACKHLGIQNQERPLIGVRGQRKDMGRVSKLLKKRRERDGLQLDKPVTIVLIDDRKCDAWGNCQANDERFLCHIPAYNAVSEERGKDLVQVMETILPAETLRKFYCAFRDADPTHALIQCVDIMSDDQSMLLKKGLDNKSATTFTYKPKVVPTSLLPPPLPTFVGGDS